MCYLDLILLVEEKLVDSVELWPFKVNTFDITNKIVMSHFVIIKKLLAQISAINWLEFF